MKKLILLSLLVCSTLCYAQDNDPFGLYENSSSSSNTDYSRWNYRDKELISKISSLDKENKELISIISSLDKENKEILDKTKILDYNKILEEKKELHTELLNWKKVNKQLLEQIKGLQIELFELKGSQKEWK
ncbi:MAG: hypothetical protein J6U44_06045 [Paludibacteraceae bacterium]|nr:hypothetical protein [Paludibacteraceae bacterium]